MKSESKIVKFTAFVLLLTIIVLCLVSGTFAKYTSHFAGEDTAIVAVWDVNGGDIEKTFDIFDKSKIYDTLGGFDAPKVEADVFQHYPADDGEVEEDTKIAPGTWGSFTYELTNHSDVSVDYQVLYVADEAGIPLKWSLDAVNWEDNVEELNVKPGTDFDGTDKEITLYWMWAFEDGTTETDAADTALGEGKTAAPTITIDVTFTQVD